MALMCGLWFLANQDILRHQCNSKRSANNRCYLTQQEQAVLVAMHHIHGLQAMLEYS